MHWHEKEKLETCLAPAILYGLEAWERLLKREIDEIEKYKEKQ